MQAYYICRYLNLDNKPEEYFVGYELMKSKPTPRFQSFGANGYVQFLLIQSYEAAMQILKDNPVTMIDCEVRSVSLL
jgi:hypothetical protein